MYPMTCGYNHPPHIIDFMSDICKSTLIEKFLNSDLEKLIWLAATKHQENKFKQRMKQIRLISHVAHAWLNEHPLEKETLYKDNDYRREPLTNNVSESYNALLKKARGFTVTFMIRLAFKNVVDRFCNRSCLA